MALDKNKGRTQPPRPLMPRLATVSGNLGSSPAPKLALRSPPSNLSSPAGSLSISVGEISRSCLSEDKFTPIKNFQTANITPRSSSRKTRADNQITPILTQNGSRNNTPRPLSLYTVGESKNGLANQPRIWERSNSDIKPNNTTPENAKNGTYLLVSSLQVSPNVETMAQTLCGSDNSPSFFHANQTTTQLAPKRPVLHEKTSSFVYANGEEEASPLATRPDKLATSRSESVRSQAIHSHPVPEIQTSKYTSSSIISKLPQSPPVSWHAFSATFFRAASPPKDNIHLSYRKGASQIIRPTVTLPVSPSTISQSSEIKLRQRQSSLDTVPDRQHHRQKAYSVSSISSKSFSSLLCTESSTQHLAKSTSLLSEHPHGLSDAPAAQDSIEGRSADDVANSPSAGVSEASNNPQHNNLAINARRERQVLDLEISNSSLLAINRSLEKEIRKQKAEIRRFKRISRTTNRTSWLSDGTSNSSLSLSSALEADTNGQSAAFNRDELDLDGDLSGEESLDEEAMSPGTLAQSDARHKKSDFRRLKLDLSKHKEMLIDSQKMNQSLERCVGMTDQLIQDGNKALEYQVRIDDVPFRGRVLSPDELEPYAMSFDGAIDSQNDDSYFRGWQQLQARFMEPDTMDEHSSVDLQDHAQTKWQIQRVPSSTLTEMMREMF